MWRRIFGRKIRLDLTRSNAQKLLWLQGERFVVERRLVRSLVRPGMRIVDVGANIGYYLLLLEQGLHGQGHVTCIEPEPTNLRELRASVAANDLANVTILPVAAGSARTQANLVPGINGRIVPAANEGLSVDVVPLDDLVEAPVDFIKVDVEGYELEVIKGAQRLIRSCRPTLFVEVHPALIACQDRVDELIDLLSTTYTHLKYFAPDQDDRVVKRLIGRYFSSYAIRRLARTDGSRPGRAIAPETTFWLVAAS